MASQGPNFPGTGADDASIGALAWTSPGNILADDGNYATATPGFSQVTHYLEATGFAFSIPVGATINGTTGTTAITITATGTITAGFMCATAGAWRVWPSAT